MEVHPDPETALSDGYQSLDFEGFRQTMELCRKVAEAVIETLQSTRQNVLIPLILVVRFKREVVSRGHLGIDGAHTVESLFEL